MKLQEIDYKLYFLIFALLMVFDAVYLFVFNEYFKLLFKRVQGGQDLTIKYGGFVATYLLMASIIYYFSNVKNFTLSEMFFLGVCIYGVYELTNFTTLANWSLNMVILDTLWGGLLFMMTSHVVNIIKLKLI